jgi:hypothetical protein
MHHYSTIDEREKLIHKSSFSVCRIVSCPISAAAAVVIAVAVAAATTAVVVW